MLNIKRVQNEKSSLEILDIAAETTFYYFFLVLISLYTLIIGKINCMDSRNCCFLFFYPSIQEKKNNNILCSVISLHK